MRKGEGVRKERREGGSREGRRTGWRKGRECKCGGREEE